MLYTLTDIEATIAPEPLAQGWLWFTEGRVTAPTVQRGGELVTAVIAQNGGRPLRVYVRMLGTGDTLTIDGECSCGKKRNCEHVAAVLLQALHVGQALPDAHNAAAPAQDNAWNPIHSRAKSNTPVAAQALLYLLHTDRQGVMIEPNVAGRLEHGGYTLGKPFDPGKATSRTPARFLQPADLEMLTALNRLPRTPDSGRPTLETHASDQLMHALLATGRCFLGESDLSTPLRLGPARPIGFEWLIDDAAVQRISGQTTPLADRLLPLAKPWYLDSETGECGLVESHLSDALLQELLALPPVGPEQVAQVYKALANAHPGVSIPTPRTFDVEPTPRVRPLPCLCLVTEELVGREEASSFHDFARLRFDYGGIEIDPEGPDTRLVDGRVVRVQRDRKAEEAAVNDLTARGLERDSACDLDTGVARLTPELDFRFGDAAVWAGFQADHFPTLRDQGWRITYKNFRHRLYEATQWTCDIERLTQDDWFSIGLGVEVDGQRVDLLPILLDALREFPRGLLAQGCIPIENLLVPFTDEQQETRLLRLPTDRVVPLLQTLLEFYDHAALVDHTDHLHVSRVQLARLGTLDPVNRQVRASGLRWLGDDEARELIERLRDLEGIPEVSPPTDLKAELRPYQRRGLNWLQFLREFRFGGILADDMGLGKTLQVLAHLLLEKTSGRANRPSLVVAPTSLMFNWLHEVRRFAPRLEVLVLQGPRRKERFAAIAEHDLVVTTYPLLARDAQELLAQRYHLLILDEAQVVKNPKVRASRVARAIDARHRLCLTGTPMENHLGELWSLYDFLLPGLLGDSKQFQRHFRTPIEKHGSDAVAHRLSCRVRPFLLRRTKQQVAKELPTKSEILQRVVLAGKQRELYETVRLAMHRRVRDEIARQGLARSQIFVLDALLKLRQVCCDPRLVDSERARAVAGSAKLDMLMQLLPAMVEDGRRILLFSQFTTMLGLIEAAVRASGIDYVTLTGQTRDRQTPVQEFQQGAAPLFLISLKAGGVGLNLTAADTVIHYDPWWNPAVERQATDRAHRIGQQQTVFVYKLICQGTVEEKIQAMQQRKQALVDGLYQGGGDQEPQWRSEDLDELFGPLQAITADA